MAETNSKLMPKPNLAEIQIPLAACGQVDFVSALPDAGDGTNLGLVGSMTGVSLQGSDAGGATVNEDVYLLLTCPSDYKAAGSFTLRIHAGALTTRPDGDCDVDVVAKRSDDDGTVGADICATAAQDARSLTLANFDFTITPATLSQGDILIIEINMTVTDSGNLGVMKSIIGAMSLIYERE